MIKSKFLKTMISSLLVCSIVLSASFITTVKTQAITTSQVKSELDSLRSQYPAGSANPKSNCYYFINLLSQNIFGHNIPTQSTDKEYKYYFTDSYKTNFIQVGKTLTIRDKTLTESSLQSLLSNTQPGDIIQMDYTTWKGADSLHVMMVYSSSTTGVVFYHAGSEIYFGAGSGSDKLNLGTTGKELTWSQFKAYFYDYDDGISVYRSKKVDGNSTSTPTYDSTSPDSYTFPSRSLYYTSPTMKGEDVKWVQAVLCKLGYTVDIDGSYGKGTVAAIESFQGNNGLVVDGKCGPATRAKLLERWNAKKSENTHTHSYSSATCTSPQKCSVCGATTGSALGHTYSNACDTSCNSCGTTRVINHTYSNTCDSSCNVCGEVREITHKFDSGVIDREPTCIKTGVKVYTCTICGGGKVEFLNATGIHTYGIWIQTKMPTCTDKGQLTRTCSNCEKKETKDVDPLGHKYASSNDVVCDICGYSDYILADIDSNNIVDIGDLASLKLYLAGIYTPTDLGLRNADINSDGVIGTGDLADMKLYLAGVKALN